MSHFVSSRLVPILSGLSESGLAKADRKPDCPCNRLTNVKLIHYVGSMLLYSALQLYSFQANYKISQGYNYKCVQDEVF